MRIVLDSDKIDHEDLFKLEIFLDNLELADVLQIQTIVDAGVYKKLDMVD